MPIRVLRSVKTSNLSLFIDVLGIVFEGFIQWNILFEVTVFVNKISAFAISFN